MDVQLIIVCVIIFLGFLALYYLFVSQKRRKIGLEKSNDRLHDLLNDIPCGYFEINNDGFYKLVSNTWLQWTNYGENELIANYTFSGMIAEESKNQYDEIFLSLMKNGSVHHRQLRVVRKDLSEFLVLVNANRMRSGTGYCFTCFDISEREIAEQKIRQLNEDLESFTYSISHDLRAPLRSIEGYTRILIDEQGAALSDQARKLLDVVIRNTIRMDALLESLLSFSQVSRKEIKKTLVDVKQMVCSIVEDLKEENPSRCVVVSVDDLPDCHADPGLLRQVWINLLSNAFKYTRKNSETIIRINGSVQGNLVTYNVTDNGTGFEMEYAHKLFQVFQRLHTTKDFEGTGVGLAIAHKIITKHNGKIWAESKLNEGASFHFSIPFV